MLTVITMYRGYDSEHFVQVVKGSLTKEQREEWAVKHNCYLSGSPEEADDEEDTNIIYFCEFNQPLNNGSLADLYNIDGKKPVDNTFTAAE